MRYNLFLALLVYIFPIFANNLPLTKEELNHFGKVSQSYKTGRKGYPQQAYEVLKKFVPVKSKILDLGCGTGISTRELYQAGYVFVSGCDKSKEQLHFASEANLQQIPYFLYDVSKEMKDQSGNTVTQEYDAACAFQALHWFADSNSLKNIYTLLKEKAFFASVDADELSPIKKEFNALMEKYLGTIHHPAKDLNHVEALINNGFTLVHQEEIESQRIYSFDEAIEWLKSNSRWSAIKERNLEKKASQDLEKLVRKHLINGQIITDIKTSVIIVQK